MNETQFDEKNAKPTRAKSNETRWEFTCKEQKKLLEVPEEREEQERVWKKERERERGGTKAISPWNEWMIDCVIW